MATINVEIIGTGPVGPTGPQGPQGEPGPGPATDEQVEAAVAHQIGGAVAEQIPETVGDWLEENVDPDTGYVIDSSLSVSNAAADAKVTGDAIDEVKSDLDTKIGFVNQVTKTMFGTGSASWNDSKLATTRRWFVNYVFPAGTILNSVKFGFSAHSTNPDRVQYFEIWEKSGDTLTKKKTVSVDVTQQTASQEVKFATAVLDYKATSDCMLCFLPSGNPPPMIYTVDPNGNDNLIVSTDVTLSTESLLYSSLSTFSIKCYPDVEINYTIDERVNVVTIGPGMDYEEIQDALLDIADDSVTNPYTLLVMPKGTPYKPFSMLRNSWSDSYPWSNISPRYISIIGVDKAHCVIRSDSGNYKLPCGELMTNGIIKNLTFIMTNDEQDASATQGGYCLHIDCRTKDDVGYTMTIEDCDFEDASGPCLGIGMHKNCTLTIRRCNFHTTLEENYSPHEGYTNLVDYGVIFCHTSTLADSTNQKINIEDCSGLCEEGNKGLWLATAGNYDPSTASFYYRLLRNVFWNKTQNAPSYSISATLTADPMNFGNNIP